MPNSSRPKEKIDERILRLIGLEDVFDLDYDTYRLLIKEILVKNSIGKQRIADQERDLLVGEIKRIRANKGRFEVKVKRTKITSESLGIKKTSANIMQKMLPGAKINTLPQGRYGVDKKQISSLRLLEKDASIIRASVESIYESISLQQKFLSKQTEQERKEQENAKRSGRESQLERRFSLLKKVADKLLAPVKSILSQILDFFIKMILGRSLIKLIDWMADPQNKGKIDSIFKFLKTFWPALLAAYILFGTRLGSFAGSIIGSVGKFLIRLTRVAIPGLLKFISRNRLGFAATALFGVGAAAELVPGMTGQQEEETKKASGTTEDKLSTLKEQRRNLNWFEKLQGKGSEIDEQIKYLETGTEKSYGFAGGGYGLVRGKKGVDQINARLSDGEFVMSPGAVKLWGADTLARMNAAGGGTNKPKIYGGKTYAAGGGPIGRSGGSDYSTSNEITKIKRFIEQKLGYNLDKPETWMSSFRTGLSGLSGMGSGGGSRSGSSGFTNQLRGLSQQGLNFANQAYNNLNNSGLQQSILNYGQRRLSDITSAGSKILSGAKNRALSILDSPLAALERYGTERENALIKSGELKPGDSLTKTTQKRLSDRDAFVKSLYDSKKDKGLLGLLKKTNRDIQNRGLIMDPFAALGLKEAGTEKFVENMSGGRVKNLGAKITGLQYAAKGLLGPLGAGFRIDDRGSLGRYVRPAMLEAQRRGQGGVGAVGLGQTNYNKMMGDRLSNLALGQFSFNVDKSGRAKTNDVYDSNKSAEEYFKKSRSALRNGNIGGALFQGLSGVLRINQNTGWGNLRPGGAGIDLGGGFIPTDSKGKPIPPKKSKTAAQSPVTMYGPNDPRRNQSGPYKSRFARPRNAGVAPVKPPVNTPKVTVVNSSKKSKPQNSNNQRKTHTPRVSASHPGSNPTKKILGIF